MKGVLRYREDILPVTICFGLFVADVVVFFVAESIFFVGGWMLFWLFPKTLISSFNHHHQHLHTFRSATLNRLLELAYTFHSGISSYGWVLHHNLGHHLHYLDQTQDESRWKDAAGKRMGVVRYSLMTVVTAYPRCWQVSKRFPKQQKIFVGMGLLTLTLLTFFLFWNWKNALLIFIIPMCVSIYNTAWHTYYHHSGLDTENEYEASFNIVEKWYNVFTGNLGYHTAHHVKMGLHWSRLPEYHEKIRGKIPQSLYRYPPAPFKWFLAKDVPAHCLDTHPKYAIA